jgi:NADPH:quinone reductase-like Zn-dependent oxidoreductase
MRAIRVHDFGDLDVIREDQVPKPTPRKGEVLVRVLAAGVGPWDVLIRTGQSTVSRWLPLTLGSDLSGIVESYGLDVHHVAAGDAVFGCTNPQFVGGYAEYAIVQAHMIAPKPRRLTHVEAASVPVVAVTAWRMLFDHAHVAPGQTVLVHGGAGAVGAYAVQLARKAQARVIATASADDLPFVRALGAEHVIDFHAARFEEVAGPVDIVIDTVGGDTQRRSFGLIAPGGILVSCVMPPDAEQAARHQVRTAFFIIDVTTDDLARIAAMLDAGELMPSVGTILPLSEARLAHEFLAHRWPRPRGKIVLRVDH